MMVVVVPKMCMFYESLSRNRGLDWRVFGASECPETQQKCLPKLVTHKHGTKLVLALP